jgi:hypothetical protein
MGSNITSVAAGQLMSRTAWKPEITGASVYNGKKRLLCKKNHKNRRFQHTVNAWKFSRVIASFFIRTLPLCPQPADPEVSEIQSVGF